MKDTPEEIADGMLKIFEKKSNTEIFFRGVADGFLEIPGDILSVAEDYFDTDNRWRNETDKIRQMALIKKGITSEDFRRLFIMVVKRYVSGLTEEHLKKLLIKIAGKEIGSISFKAAVVNELIALFVTRVIPRFLTSIGLTGVISIGAIQSRSIYSSYDLKQLNSTVYYDLRGAGDLDLLYFTVKEYVDPYLKAINYQEMNSPISNVIFNRYYLGVNGV